MPNPDKQIHTGLGMRYLWGFFYKEMEDVLMPETEAKDSVRNIILEESESKIKVLA